MAKNKQNRDELVAQEMARRAVAQQGGAATTTVELPDSDLMQAAAAVLGNGEPQAETATTPQPAPAPAQLAAEVSTTDTDDSEEIAVENLIDAMAAEIQDLRATNIGLTHRLSLLEGRFRQVEENAADAVRQYVEDATSDAFGRWMDKFKRTWEPQFVKVFRMVESVQKGASDLLEIRQHLPHLRLLAGEGGLLNTIQTIAGEVKQVRAQILEALRAKGTKPVQPPTESDALFEE